MIIGVDIGNYKSVVAINQGGMINILANDYGENFTPSLVGLGQRNRLFGEIARHQQHSYLTSTIGNLKRLLGVRPREENFATELELSLIHI